MPLAEIQKRIKAQYELSYYTEKSDYVIYNDSTLSDLQSRVINVVERLNEAKDGTI